MYYRSWGVATQKAKQAKDYHENRKLNQATTKYTLVPESEQHEMKKAKDHPICLPVIVKLSILYFCQR